MQPRIAIGAVTNSAGVLNGRWRPGSVRRITSTAMDTAAKANRVPELELFASCPTGKQAANSATAIPVRIVMTCGVWNFGGNFENDFGSTPRRHHPTQKST